MTSAHGGRVLCGSLALAMAGAFGVLAADATTLDRELPGEVRRPTDVRWLDDDTLLISVAKSGVLKIGLSGSDLTSSPFAEEEGRFRSWVHLGSSPGYVAGAFIAFNSWWWTREGRDDRRSLSIEYVADLDLHEDRLLLTGLRRDGEGELGADGAMAWLVDLAQEEIEPEPVLPFPDDALQTLQDCATVLLPKARFMADGSFLLVPGVEPGLLYYQPSGHLARTWDTDALGLDQECLLSEAQKRRFNTDVAVRQGWLNRRRVVDEVLPLPAGPGLLVRSRADGITRWELLRLDPDGQGSGEWRSVPLSITSPSPWVRARGDVRGNRLAVLLAPDPPQDVAGPPARLLIFKLQP